MSLSFLTLTESITEAGAFWLYAAFGVLACVYTYYQVPETKGKNEMNGGGEGGGQREREEVRAIWGVAA